MWFLSCFASSFWYANSHRSPVHWLAANTTLKAKNKDSFAVAAILYAVQGGSARYASKAIAEVKPSAEFY